jgi:uncharacterized protein
MRCPICKRETAWQENPWRPFCSERCKLIDLDNWLSGRYRISSPFTHDDEADALRAAEPVEPAKEERG